MINWFKKLFAPTKPSEGMVPISSEDLDRIKANQEFDELVKDIKERDEIHDPFFAGGKEWVYIGDGMVEEVIRQPKVKPLNESRLNERRSPGYDTPTYIHTPSYSNDSYDTGGYSSCDSGSSGGCD